MASGARSRQEAEQLLIRKAEKDESFRKRLLADPRSVISEELGVSLSGVSLKVLEETPTQLYLVLPPSAHRRSELADAELDAVAGGTVPQNTSDAGKFSKGGAVASRPEELAGLQDPLAKDKLGQGGMGGLGSGGL